MSKYDYPCALGCGTFDTQGELDQHFIEDHATDDGSASLQGRKTEVNPRATTGDTELEDKLRKMEVEITSIKGLPHNVKGGLTDETIAQIRLLIDQKITQGQIDENEGWLKGVAGRYPLLKEAIPRRINELKAELKAKEKK